MYQNLMKASRKEVYLFNICYITLFYEWRKNPKVEKILTTPFIFIIPEIKLHNFLVNEHGAQSRIS